jgi:hypothetical protein
MSPPRAASGLPWRRSPRPGRCPEMSHFFDSVGHYQIPTNPATPAVFAHCPHLKLLRRAMGNERPLTPYGEKGRGSGAALRCPRREATGAPFPCPGRKGSAGAARLTPRPGDNVPTSNPADRARTATPPRRGQRSAAPDPGARHSPVRQAVGTNWIDRFEAAGDRGGDGATGGPDRRTRLK